MNFIKKIIKSLKQLFYLFSTNLWFKPFNKTKVESGHGIF
jgi:hypothetical protein